MLRATKALTMIVIAAFCLATAVHASALSRPQILKELQDLELCIRTMCLPSNDASMSIGGCQTLVAKLNVSPNNLDRWTIQRVNGVALLLQQKKIKDGLVQMQATIKELPAQ